MSSHSLKKRKELGAYYTPAHLSQVLSNWAVRNSNDVILEPSFGGCGFLEAIVSTLTTLGCKNPEKQVFGADIDAEAFGFLSEKLGSMIDLKQGHFIHGDFLKLTPNTFKKSEFDVVIGNPPYVSLHNMPEEQKKTCTDSLSISSFAEKSIGRNASLWAFFLIHSLQFIKNGGRIAWVLPSSVLHTDYAKNILAIHQKHFKKIKLIKLYERFFQYMGADEVSIILVAEDFQKEHLNKKTKIEYCHAEDVISLKNCFQTNDSTFSFHQNYKFNIIPFETAINYIKLEDDLLSKKLGGLCKVTIGMVTGDNKTFIINSDQQKEFNLSSSYLKPVVRKFSQLKGLNHTRTKHLENKKNNESCLLVCPRNLRKKFSPIRSYLAKVTKQNRKNNKTFPKRLNWYYPDDGLYPDAFFTYMIDCNPRMVLNEDKINCTNSIHRLYFINSLSESQKKAISISLLSSFSQLSAELEGRSYGSGVLKLEPSAVKNLKLLYSDELTSAFVDIYDEVNQLISENQHAQARAIVDNVICQCLSLPIEIFKQFSHSIRILKEDRYKGLHTQQRDS
ncbi:MAG: N-6 DNA methylase [Methyloprofundus sp.]|nr:N-6 DNA methylase [Methyloprofundus sp.]